MATAVRALAAAAVLTLLGVGGGVLLTGHDGASVTSRSGDATPAGTPQPTDLADLDTSTLGVQRAAFCDAVDSTSVSDALGGDATGASSYGDGDRALLPGGADVVAEYDCTWQGPSGTEAQAWVFAPPVDTRRATTLVAAARRTAHCDAIRLPAYGSPSTGLVCDRRGQITVSYRGLFGDAWLTCQLTNGTTDLGRAATIARASRWCAAVAQAAS